MLGKIFGILCLVALVFGGICGNMTDVANAIPDGAARAVEVTISLCGMMCLWCGLMEVLADAGVIRRLSRLLSPFLRRFFPNAYRTGEGAEEISAAISANLLGIGNAATPLALRAMEQMQKHNPDPTRADGEQITLAVLNTASVTLIPANLLALRRAAGSSDPFAIMIPVWLTSCLCAAMALLLTSIPRFFSKKGRRTQKRK
ncbi:MAG: spore maturation protein A [Clostridia bacterium]|nr:spore maturation protein A [Clostridia bacterium]